MGLLRRVSVRRNYDMRGDFARSSVGARCRIRNFQTSEKIDDHFLSYWYWYWYWYWCRSFSKLSQFLVWMRFRLHPGPVPRTLVVFSFPSALVPLTRGYHCGVLRVFRPGEKRRPDREGICFYVGLGAILSAAPAVPIWWSRVYSGHLFEHHTPQTPRT